MGVDSTSLSEVGLNLADVGGKNVTKMTEYRQKIAKEQAGFLEGMETVDLGDALGPYWQMIYKEEGGENTVEGGDSAEVSGDIDGLRTLFTPEDGYVLKYLGKDDGDDVGLYAVASDGVDGKASMITVLKKRDDKKVAGDLYEVKRHIYHNDKGDSFDLVTGLPKGMKYNLIVGENVGNGGNTDLIHGNLEVFFQDKEAVTRMAFYAAHEIGHSFQDLNGVSRPMLWNCFVGPLNDFFPSMAEKVFPGLKKNMVSVDVFEQNIHERNADAFSFGLYRKLRELGINVSDVIDENREISKQRKKQRKDNYGSRVR